MLLAFTYYDETVKKIFMQSMQSFSSKFTITTELALVILSNTKPADREIRQLNQMFSSVSVVRPTRVPEIDPATNLSVNNYFVETLLSYSKYDRLYIDPNLFLINSFTLPKDTSLFFKQSRGQLSTKLIYLKSGNQFNSAFSAIRHGAWINNISEQEFTYVIHNNYLIPKIVYDKHIVNGRAYNESNIQELVFTNQVAIDTSDAIFMNSKTSRVVDKLSASNKVITLSKIITKHALDGLVPFEDLVDEPNVSVKVVKPAIRKNIVMELPFYDRTAGGINRAIKIVMELPHYSKTCGGIRDNIFIAQEFEPTMELRFQNLAFGAPTEDIGKWSVGLPDETFPDCDICITYSDNPYVDKLVNLPQVRKVFILMLSYGMNLPVERANVLNPKLTVLCSSKKLEKAITAEGVKVHRLGLGLDMSAMYVDKTIERKKYLAILYNNMLSKKYETGVEVADILYKKGIIDGVITFGRADGYERFSKPRGLVKHYANATPDQIREIFNKCQCFLMPSITEGLNLTPIESTLCGCPTVMCDGAIGEVFFDERNCFIVPIENRNKMVDACTRVIKKFNKYSELFRKDMEIVTRDMNWPAVLKNLTQVIIDSDPSQVIIIPVHNQLEYLKACVKTVLEKTTNPKVIIVDDGSLDKEIPKWVKENTDFTLISHPKALGFSAACNDGINYAMKHFNFDTLCLLNSDTEIVTDNWFGKIEREMKDHGIGIAGPVSNNAVYQTIQDPISYLKAIDEKPTIDSPFVHGFCYFIRRTVISKLGLLDGDLFPHYGSEDDYSLKSVKYGFKNSIIGSVFVKHQGETSYSTTTRTMLLKTSIPNLNKKWGKEYIDSCVNVTANAYKKLNSI